MIVTFSIANFRSFSEEETFSLVASNRFSGSHEHHAVQIPNSDARVLRVGVLYGANGAGKSNFFKALEFLRGVALFPKNKGQSTGRQAFRFLDRQNEPSVFDLQFIVADKLYQYGIVVDDDRVLEEWLIEMVGNREKVIYERVIGEDGGISVSINESLGGDDKLKALARIGGPHNQSFLATVRATLDTSDYGEVLPGIFNWFESALTLIEPDSTFMALAHFLNEDAGFQAFASEFLKASSTGVDNLNVVKKEISEEQLKGLLSESAFRRVTKETETKGVAVVPLDPNRVIVVEQSEESRFYSLTIQSVHEHETGKPIRLDIAEESDGTRRLLNLIPALHFLHTKGGAFVIDEIDRSMHPLLIWKFIQFFLESCGGERRQMIVTTHECNLLDLDLLRRDEIWFAEKDRDGATKLYSLADFKVRNDLKIQKHYLQGRFGAVPFLGNVDRLMEREPTSV